jgi:hypothetical protein
MGVKNDSTLVFSKYRVIFDPPLDGAGLINKGPNYLKVIGMSIEMDPGASIATQS